MRVDGVSVEPGTKIYPEYAVLRIKGKLVDGQVEHWVLYHFEHFEPSTPFWCAVGKALVDFFGGYVDYKDCDNWRIDYKKPKAKDLGANDGQLWQDFQNRIYAVKKLTADDLAKMKQFAEYE